MAASREWVIKLSRVSRWTPRYLIEAEGVTMLSICSTVDSLPGRGLPYCLLIWSSSGFEGEKGRPMGSPLSVITQTASVISVEDRE